MPMPVPQSFERQAIVMGPVRYDSFRQHAYVRQQTDSLAVKSLRPTYGLPMPGLLQAGCHGAEIECHASSG